MLRAAVNLGGASFSRPRVSNDNRLRGVAVPDLQMSLTTRARRSTVWTRHAHGRSDSCVGKTTSTSRVGRDSRHRRSACELHDRETPKDKTLHLIADNYATHNHPAVQDWPTKHPRCNMHFTPASVS